MKHLKIFSIVLFATIAAAQESAGEEVEAHTGNECPTGVIKMAGATGAEGLVKAWVDDFKTTCPNFELATEGGGYPMGAARVCDNHILYGAVDMAGMSGLFFNPQATTSDGWRYTCKGSGRNTLLVHAAQQGVIAQTASTGPAAECIKILGGLSIDQLRWMVTTLPISELDHTGWKASSVPFSDANDNTHYWSELNGNCSATEIKIAGTPAGSAAYEYLVGNVLTTANEIPRTYQEVNDFHELSSYLQANEGAVAFYHLYDILSPGFAKEISYVQPIPIENTNHEFILPATTAFEDEKYPLLRNIYLGVNAEPASMALTRPILEHGYSLKGDEILMNAGYWPIKGWKKLVVLTKIQSKHAFPLDKISQYCSDSQKELSIAGSTSVEPVSHLWASMLDIACPITVDLHGGGSTIGGKRICGDLDAGSPVDIGNMSRDFLDKEATERSLTFVHDCVQGNDKRSSVVVEVALDALAVVVPRDGPGHRCIQTLGGLTRDQLRWIYSSYNSAELIETGWDPASLRNSDGNPETHRWSELDPRCDPEEIRLTGGLRGDGPSTALTNYILTDQENGETIADIQQRPDGYFGDHEYETMVEVEKDVRSISFLSYHYYFKRQGLFYATPLQGSDGSFVEPSKDTIADHTYPLVRTLYMNLLNEEESLASTVPLLEFGFANPDLLDDTGYVPMEGDLRMDMLDRLHGAPYAADESVTDDSDDSMDMEIVGSVVGGCLLLIVLCVIGCCYYQNYRNKQV